MKAYEDSCSETQPVILIGVEEQEAKGFEEVKLVIQTKQGETILDKKYTGKISVRMVNSVLEIFVKKER
jgi:hypothetical protein